MRTTIEEFKNCRQLITEIDGTHDGLSYPGGLHILVVDEKWPPAVQASGSYYLQIANEEVVSPDLLALESRLYEYGMKESLFV